MLGNDREATVSAGANSLDWDLQGATLRVTLRGWTHRAPVDIQLMQRSMSKPGKVGDVIRLSPTGSLPAVFTGISYGRYAVQAKEVLPAGVGPAQVAGTTIDVDQSGEADVELELGDPPGIVRVFGDGNQLIGNATVRIAAGGNALNETEPGVFSLGDMAPSSLVLVSAPGFTPVCRLVPTQSPFDVFLVRGVRVRLLFIGGNVAVLAGILTWPGTDCAVPLDRFEVGRSSAAAADFIVRNFPADPNVVYIPGAFDPPERRVPITPDSNGVIRITVVPR
jgi:hypothetical protein